jgi:hypothetical protein
MRELLTGQADGKIDVQVEPLRRRLAPRMLGALTMAVLSASLMVGCGSSTKVSSSPETSSPDTSASDSTSTTSPSKQSGPLADITGTWTSVDQSAKFCGVGTAIGAGGAEPTSTVSPCVIPLTWSVMHRVDVDAGGRMSMTFSYQGMGASDGASGGASLDGTCTAAATIDGHKLALGDLACQPAKGDTTKLDDTALAGVDWKLDGACLKIDDTWFEQTTGECADKSAEDKFNAVGNAIENAS